LNLGYDRKCAHTAPEEAADRAHRGEVHVIRFRAPEQWPCYDDLVYGKTGHGIDKAKRLLVDEPVWEDAILLKSDGFPTYHWANICDDHEMKITHVVRGAEWMSSTPLHVALYQALGWQPPLFSHVPLLVDQNKQKLSKRNFDSDIGSFKNAGIVPEALTNFAALLGWSHQQRSDIMSLKELEDRFDLKITKGNTIVSFDKLRYLQEQHARRRIIAAGEELEQMIRDVAVALLDKHGAAVVGSFVGKRELRAVIASLLRADSIPYRSSQDFADRVAFFLSPLERRPPLKIRDSSMLQDLRIAASTLCLVPEEAWTKEVHRANISGLQISLREEGEKASVEEQTWKKELYHFLRWALLGGAPGPSVPDMMEIFGRETCVQRIQDAVLESKDVEIART
jgi:glutamyl-tRNA synthetase